MYLNFIDIALIIAKYKVQEKQQCCDSDVRSLIKMFVLNEHTWNMCHDDILLDQCICSMTFIEVG